MVDVLFICEGNVFRSQMAEGFYRHYFPEGNAMSAGTHVQPHWEGKKVGERFDDAIVAMQKEQIDIAQQTMKKLTPAMLSDARRVIVVGEIVAGVPDFLKAWPNVVYWDVLDPGYGHSSIEDARDAIQDKVEALVAEMRTS